MSNKSKRAKAKGSWYPAPALVRKRIAEMTRAFASSFPDRKLPNNGLGRKLAKYMMRTKRLYPSPLDHLWLKQWCPWMIESDQDRMLGQKGHWYSSASLGQHLEVDNQMRNELRLWTMRPNDVDWTQVHSERKKQHYLKRQAKRHAEGVKPRRKGSAEPWKALGISKPTYYRRKLHLEPETPESGVSPPVGTADSQVSHGEAAPITSAAPSQPQCPERRSANNVADDPGIILGGIRDRALRALASRPVPATPSKPQGRDRFPADNVIEFPIRKREPADIDRWPSGRPMGLHRKSMPLAA
jgi:hypothetical protein